MMAVDAAPGQRIGLADQVFTEALPQVLDLLLIRTGFEAFRGEEIYWAQGPGLTPDTAGALKERFPSLQAVGFDFISISSLAHRDEGRAAHRAFLGAGIRIFEDLSFSGLSSEDVLDQVVALPLRLAGGDGAPCTVIGFLAGE